MFDAEHRIAGPDNLEILGLPNTHIQAALRLKEHHGQQTYFFKSGRYWRLDPQENRVDAGFPRSIKQDWWGIPDEIDAAFQDAHGMSAKGLFIMFNDYTNKTWPILSVAHSTGYVIFINRRQYWKFDPVHRKVLEGYPRYVGQDFFECSTP